MSCQKSTYGGLINVYSTFFQTKVKYCSDSNGYWRFDRLWDIINDSAYKQLQILTHPEWWTINPGAPRDKIVAHINHRAKRVLDYYDNILKLDNRNNMCNE